MTCLIEAKLRRGERAVRELAARCLELVSEKCDAVGLGAFCLSEYIASAAYLFSFLVFR